MARAASQRNHKPRELRRRVMLSARMRAGSGWSDACILNVSSRGLLIQASRPTPEGSTIELWHGERLIVAKVVWRQGLRAGLRADGRVPVEDIMALVQAPALQLTAQWPQVERRKRVRTHDESRLRSRLIEFGGIAVIAASLALGAFSMVEAALARPMGYAQLALGSG